MNNISYKIINNNNVTRMSLLEYVGKNHPYKMFYIINLCLASGLFVSTYTIGKTSLFMFIMYIISNNYWLIVIFLLFVLYPLVFIILIHPIIINNVNHNLYSKSLLGGINLNNIYIFLLTFLSLINLYLFIYILIIPIVNYLSYILSYNIIYIISIVLILLFVLVNYNNYP